MRRKLVFDDYLRLKKLFTELGLADQVITINLKDRTAEAEGELFGENSELYRKYNLRSEGEIIFLLSARNEIPEPTGLRYLQYFRDYFDETDQGKLIFSTYNVKLLQAINLLISKGLAPDEVGKILREGEREAAVSELSANTEPGQQTYRGYERATEPFAGFPDIKQKGKTGGKGKVAIWALAICVLILATLGVGHRLGYLDRYCLSVAVRPVPGPVVGEETAEPGVAGDVEIETGKAEVPLLVIPEPPAEPEIPEPALPALAPAEITVEVLNGSGVRGVAARFAEKLKQRGYRVVYVGNADRFDYSRSQLINRLEERAVTEDLPDLIPQAEIRSEAPEQDKPMITIILGDDFRE